MTDPIILCIATCILIIITYISFENVRKCAIPNWFLLNQALVDSLIAIESIMYTIPTISTLVDGNHGIYVNITTAIELYSVILALGVLILITADRFIALCFPFFHRNQVTIQRVVSITVMWWFIALAPSVFYVLHYHYHGDDDRSTLDTFFMVGSSLILAGILLVLLFLYFTYRSIRRSHVRRISSDALRTTQWSSRRNHIIISEQQQKQRRLFKLFLLISVVYIISYIPGVVIRVVNYTGVVGNTMRDIELEVAFIVYMCSALFNPILTLSIKDDFKKKMSCRTKKRKTSRPSVSTMQTMDAYV